VLRRLDAADTHASDSDSPVEIVRGEARFVLQVGRFDPGAVVEDTASSAEEVETLETPTGQLALFGEVIPVAPSSSTAPSVTFGELLAPERPPAAAPRRLSFSAISLFERCSLRFWAERVAGMRPVREAVPLEGASRPGGTLLATEFGDAVHRLLELVDLDDPKPPDPGPLEATLRAWYPIVTPSEVARVTEHVLAYCTSPLAQRIAALGGARPERPFTFEVDGVLLRGRLDVLWRDGARALVLDYKTNVLDGHTPAEIVDAEYGLQRAVYALVCLLAGAQEAEVVYQFLEAPDDIVSTTYTAADRDRLLEEVGAAVGRVVRGEIRARPSAFVCQGCPLRGVACAGTDMLEEESF
jgi:hypothetical protein